MKITDTIRRAGRSLSQAKARTLLTSLAIGVGAFTIALAMAAGNGGRAYLDSMVGSLGSTRNINVAAKQGTQAEEDTTPRKVGEEAEKPSQGNFFNLIPASDIEKIRGVDGVEVVLPIISVHASAVEANGSDQYEANVQVQYDDSALEIVAGALGDNHEIKKGSVVLPELYVESFGFKNAEAALGSTVTMTFSGSAGGTFTRDFTVVAVDKEPKSPLTAAMYQDQFRLSNEDGAEIAALQRPADSEDSYYGAMVRAKAGANVDTVKNDIIALGSFEAQTFAEMRSSVMEVINIVQYGLMAFGALAILASVFGIINTQYISVLERTQQIGLMKALGARRRDVGRLFRYEAAWIGFLGGVIGVVLAFGVTLLNPVFADLLSLEDGTALLQMDWIMSVVLVLGLMVIAIVSGYFPSRKAAKLDPIEALRTE